MKNKFFNILLLLALPMVVFVGCKEKDSSNEKGFLTVNAYNKGGIIINNDVDSDTKSHVPASDTYKVEIAQILTGEVAYATTYGSIKSSPLAIEQGIYRVTARNIDVADAQWEAPRYAGLKDITIKAGQSTTVAIECLLTNCKVTVEVDELFKSVFQINSVVISNANGGQLEYIGNEGKSGYFTPSNLTVSVNATRKSDGQERLLDYEITNAESGTWYKVKVKVKLFANTDFGIVVERDIVQEHDTEIDPLG